MQTLSFVFHRNKIFHCFHFQIFKKPSSLRSRKFVEKELIGEEWYFILAPKKPLTRLHGLNIKREQDNICKSYFPWVSFVSNFIKLILNKLMRRKYELSKYENWRLDKNRRFRCLYINMIKFRLAHYFVFSWDLATLQITFSIFREDKTIILLKHSSRVGSWFVTVSIR